MRYLWLYGRPQHMRFLRCWAGIATPLQPSVLTDTLIVPDRFWNVKFSCRTVFRMWTTHSVRQQAVRTAVRRYQSNQFTHLWTALEHLLGTFVLIRTYVLLTWGQGKHDTWVMTHNSWHRCHASHIMIAASWVAYHDTEFMTRASCFVMSSNYASTLCWATVMSSNCYVEYGCLPLLCIFSLYLFTENIPQEKLIYIITA